MHRFDQPDRRRYVALALFTVAIGLAVHLSGSALPRDLRDVAGDALWACMMVWWVSALYPGMGLNVRVAAAYSVCVLVELSQLIHTPALDMVRATAVGHLVLGSDFDGLDLASYLGGVCLAVAVERRLRPRR